MVETDYAVADRPLINASTDFYGGTGDFMAEDLRRRYQTVTDFFDIRSADAAGGNADQYFAVRDFRHRHVFNNNLT